MLNFQGKEDIYMVRHRVNETILYETSFMVVTIEQKRQMPVKTLKLRTFNPWILQIKPFIPGILWRH